MSITTEVAPSEPPVGPQRGLGARTSTLIVLTVALTVVLVAAVGLAGAAIGRSTRGGSPGTITVSATGTVRGKPDTVQFTIGVQTTQPTAPAALEANNQRVKRLEGILGNLKVPPDDQQTSGLNIWQDTTDQGVITGFTVQDSLTVTMHNLTRAGIAIEASAKLAGRGIQFDGISLSISDDSNLLAKARARALSTAHAEAMQDARGSGTSVGSVVRISDQETQAAYAEPLDFGYANATAGVNVPLRAGTEPITVNVTVVYALGG